MKTKLFFLILCSFFVVSAIYGQKAEKKSNKKITITGYVKDETQKPIANAIVMIDGAKSKLITDSEGYYKIKVRSDAGKIAIFTTTNGVMEEPVNGRTRINFTFAGSVPDQVNPNNKSAGEDDINVGYGSIKRKNLTSPVNEIDVTQSKYASYRTVYEVLKSGSVPGVIVNGNSVKIQGASSLTLSTEPLFVVDGMTVSSVDDIQPQMIKSIQVLKGSAASIYGSRGANGVILINLIKGGEKNK